MDSNRQRAGGYRAPQGYGFNGRTAGRIAGDPPAEQISELQNPARKTAKNQRSDCRHSGKKNRQLPAGQPSLAQTDRRGNRQNQLLSDFPKIKTLILQKSR